MGVVASVNAGRVAPLVVGGRTLRSAIGKRALAGRVAVHRLGIEGDEQADPRFHGGPAKAVYAYPSVHYAFWRTVRAQARAGLWDDEPLPPGFLGENLTLDGLVEADTWIGDRLVLPDCTLAVSAPRTPCAKFAAVMGFAQAPKMMLQSGWCGFYLTVIEPGTVAAGDAFRVEPGPREVNIVERFRAGVSSSAR